MAGRKWMTGMLLAVVAWSAAPARAEFGLKDGDRVVFFGDVALDPLYCTLWVDQFIRIKYPTVKVEMACLGFQGSNAANGNERFTTEVMPLQPTKVVACFGLEDGQRKAFDQALLDQYVAEMGKLIEAARGKNVELLLITPPPPQEWRFKGLELVKYGEVVSKYAEALTKLAAEKGVPVVDWHGAVLRYLEQHKDMDKPTLTKDGIQQDWLSIAILADALLTHWQAEPFQFRITADWAEPTKVAVSAGNATITEHDDNHWVVQLRGVPAPMAMPERQRLSDEQWPMAKWCDYRVQIKNMPDGGVVVSDGGKDAKPFLTQQFAEGADLSVIGPLAENLATKGLVTALRVKDNQFARYRDFCHKKVPEPELAEGYRLYVEAERALALGTLKVLGRAPTVLAADLNLQLVSKAAAEAAATAPAEPKPGMPVVRPKPPTSRPADGKPPAGPKPAAGPKPPEGSKPPDGQ